MLSSKSVIGIGHTLNLPQGPFENDNANSIGKSVWPWMAPRYKLKLPMAQVPLPGAEMPVERGAELDTVPVGNATPEAVGYAVG